MSLRPFLLAALLCPALAVADAPDAGPPAGPLATALPAVDQAFRGVVDRGESPGIVWGVVAQGQLVHAGAAGFSEVQSRTAPAPDTAFRIASMTKSFTAAAILKLRDAGRLSLEDRVDRWLPEVQGWAPATADAAPLTVRMLLSHGAGFAEDNPWGDRQLAIGEDLFGRWLKQGFLWSTSPGTEYEYSNTGFAMLGRIVARASGMPYRAFVDQQLLQPLGLTATRWSVDAFPPAQQAHGYRKTVSGWQEELPLGDGVYGAMGGLVTTVPDLARWVAFQLSAWPPRDDADPGPLRRASLREMQQLTRATPVTLYRPDADAPLVLGAGGYAFGLGGAQTCYASLVVGHSGGLPGWGSQMRWIPQVGVGLVAMTNVTYGAPGLPRAMLEAFTALHRAGALVPRPRTPAPGLVEAQGRVNGWLARWDGAEVTAASAENFLLDSPLDARRRDFAELRALHGACQPDGPLRPDNALRGTWRLRCERGTVELHLTLAPLAPARIQELEVTSALPLDPGMRNAATRLAALAARWSDGAARALLTPTADPRALRAQLDAIRILHGTCTPGEVVSGDGHAKAALRYTCTRAPVVAELARQGKSGRLSSVRFSKPEGLTCPD